MKIKINGKNYAIKFAHVYGFSTTAFVRVGRRRIESAEVPFLFTDAAAQKLLERALKHYPDAALA
jgi:hypothetical protein